MRIIICIFFSILGICCFGLTNTDAEGLCENEKLGAYISTDARLKVIVFQRNCGATTGPNTQASLLDANASLPDDAGNLFIADTGHGQAPSASGGGPEVKVGWIDSKHLVLKHHAKARIFKSEHQLNGVDIRYETY